MKDYIVIHFVYTLHGGVASVAANLICEQHKQGVHCVVAFVEYASFFDEMLGFEVEYVKLDKPQYPGRNMLFGIGLRQTYRKIRNKNPEAIVVVHAHNIQTIGLFSNIDKIPLICTLHGTHGCDHRLRARISNLATKFAIKRLIRKGKPVAAVSNYVKNFYGKDISSHTSTIYNGIGRPNNIKMKHSSFTMGHIGNISIAKGWDTTYAAYKRLAFKYGRFIRFLFAGDLHDIELKEVDGQLSSNEFNIEYRGYVANAGKVLLPEIDVLILASRNEGLPVCLIEAIANGIPVIGTNVGGIPEIIEDGANGFLIDNDLELSEKIEKLYLNKGLYYEMSSNAKKIYDKKFASVVMAFKYNELYHRANYKYQVDE